MNRLRLFVILHKYTSVGCTTDPNKSLGSVAAAAFCTWRTGGADGGAHRTEYTMITTHTSRRSVTATLGAVVAGAAASALLFSGAGAANAATIADLPLLPCASCAGFDPQPDPPRPSDRLNPSHKLNPSQGLNPPPGLKGDGSV
jgi:hypothetical protein